MGIRLLNPYDADGNTWLQGNLHTHSTLSDGNLPIQDTIQAYADLGYDFLMLSDHDHFNDGAGLDPCGMTLIPGNEITDGNVHLLHVYAEEFIPPDLDRQEIVNRINRGRGFAIMNHPNWEKNFNHCDQSVLEGLQGYAGIEIFNGVCLYAEGSGNATDRWDRLLGKGRRVWGYGNDDNHADIFRGLGWNMVQSDSRNVEDIVEALRNGRLYVSTGVTIRSIKVEGATLSVETENAECLYVYSDFQRLESRVYGGSVSFTLPEDATCTYLRVECFGPGDRMAWTQPFFVEQS